MIESSPKRPLSRTPLASILALAAIAGLAVAPALALQAPQQGGHPAQQGDPARAVLEVAPDGNPAEVATEEDAARIARAVEMLGESPVAAVLAHLPWEARRFTEHVTTLSNPFFEGRQPGTRGNEYAAQYLEHYFRQFGLQPAFEGRIEAHDGTEVLEPRASYRQTFRAGRDTRIAEERAAIVIPAGEGEAATRRQLKAGEDFVVMSQSGDGRITAPIVFAGYGLVDGPEGHSDFPADSDFTGKIVMIFRFEPMDEDGRSLFAERGWSPAAQIDAKINNVAERGAAGVILVNPPGADDPRADQLINTRGAMLGRAVGRGVETPVIMMSTEVAEDLFDLAFPDGDVTLLSARQQADEGGFAFEMPEVEVELGTRIAREPILTDNVGAILPGRGGLASEFVVIGAHYDHVGIGPAGVINPANLGTMHPGADDNASGTSGMLVLAEKLSEAYAKLGEGDDARSILFIGFSAEEMGLIGSRYFVNNPPMGISPSDIAIMVNLDMIGRLREENMLEVSGVETGEGLLDWLKPYLDESGLPIKHGSRVSGNSDHASFHRAGIPAIFFFTDLHREYHQPGDVSSLINQAGAARVINLAYDIALGLTQRGDRFEFAGRRQPVRGGRAAAPAQPAEEQRPLPGGRARMNIRFGIAPGNYSDEEPGILVDDVYEDTSAAEAGIKVGDRMVRWNDTPLTNVESWMPLLMQHKPGDVVKVTVVRGGREVTVEVTLKARGGDD